MGWFKKKNKKVEQATTDLPTMLLDNYRAMAEHRAAEAKALQAQIAISAKANY